MRSDSTRAWTARGVITATLALPVIYSLLLPFVLLDLWLQVYQAVAFRLLSLQRVRRRDYVVIDRLVLPYLNPIQKANCTYCGYVNGLVAFTREIAGRTEQDLVPHQTQGPITRRASASASFRAVRRCRRVYPTPAAVAPGARRDTVTPSRKARAVSHSAVPNEDRP